MLDFLKMCPDKQIKHFTSNTRLSLLYWTTPMKFPARLDENEATSFALLLSSGVQSLHAKGKETINLTKHTTEAVLKASKIVYILHEWHSYNIVVHCLHGFIIWFE